MKSLKWRGYILSMVLSHIPPSVIAPESSKEIKFQFILLSNGSLVPVIQKDPIEEIAGSAISMRLVTSVFLLLLIMIGLIANSLIVGTISSSLVLKRIQFNLLLLNCAIACIIECILNCLLSVIYILTQPGWDLGPVPCYINSFFMEFVPILYTTFLILLVLDRYFAVRDPMTYRKNYNNQSKFKFAIVFYWILSIGAIFPLAIGIIQSWPFPDRYSCQPMDELTRLYGCVTSGLCYILFWLGIVVTMILIHRICQAERKKERKSQRGRESNNKLAEPSMFMMAMNQNVHLWTEMKHAMLVLGLIIIYLLFMAPYIIRIKVDQIIQDYDHDYYRNLTLALYYNTNHINETTNTTKPSEQVQNPTPTPKPNASSNLTNNETEIYQVANDLFVPEVTEEFLGDIDSVCVWLRYIHAVLVPILIFIVHKDLRKKAEIIVCCCWRPNSVETNKKSSQEMRPISAYLHQKRREWEKKQKKFKHITNHNVPVLFASSDGLYLRLVDETAFNPGEEGAEDILEGSIKGQWSVEPKFVMEMCDLSLPMSASRNRLLTAEDGQPNFGTTVTVLMKNDGENLKSSLKKPRPVRSSPEEDEGFIDEVAEPKKSVQFNSNPEILVEIPSSTSQDDNIKTVDEAKAEKSEEIPIHEELGAKRHKTVLPPLNGSPKKPQKKSSKNKQRHRTEEAAATAQ